MQQHRTIEVGDATLECILCGPGAPVVLLANAGCSTGYLDHLARVLATGGLQTISINMRGVRGSRGPLDGTTLHDLAGDVAGVIKAVGCGPVHLVGHAFGNRIARCLAADLPPRTEARLFRPTNEQPPRARETLSTEAIFQLVCDADALAYPHLISRGTIIPKRGPSR